MALLPTDSGLEQVYPIVEIFHSIQGEGFHTGEASVFIRFGRCNLRCPWCDTEFDEWEDMSLGQLIDAVTQNKDVSRVLYEELWIMDGGQGGDKIGFVLGRVADLVRLFVGCYHWKFIGLDQIVYLGLTGKRVVITAVSHVRQA